MSEQEPTPNRAQKRKAAKSLKGDTVTVVNVLLVMGNGNVIPLDVRNIDITDKTTGNPIFKHSEKK